jgi:putative N6-adenine-specific DNA methylase
MGQRADHERVFVQCLPGLEPVLQAEARRIGHVHLVAGGIELDGPAGVHAEAALVLRAAERVLLRLLEFPVRRWPEVEAGLRSARLDEVVGPGAALALEASIRVAGAPAPRALAGILTRLWQRPVEPARADDRTAETPRLLLRVVDGRASLSADVGGELLHRRGWRQETSRAPLRETLAAGVLALAGYVPEQPLRDPVCGSGTLIIEGALIARVVAPGLGRTFAAERWPRAERDDWTGRRDRLRSLVRSVTPASIVGRPPPMVTRPASHVARPSPPIAERRSPVDDRMSRQRSPARLRLASWSATSRMGCGWMRAGVWRPSTRPGTDPGS